MEPGEYDLIAQVEARHWWYRGMRYMAEGWLRRWVWPSIDQSYGRPARVLDAGCGTGGGLRWLAKHGQVTGVDFHPMAVRYAARTGQAVTRGSVGALPYDSESFEVVTSFDVLYHAAVPDDAAAVRELARVLRPGGWLLVRVPAYDWLRGAHDRQVHTRRRYTTRGMRQLMEMARLQVRRLSYAGLGLLAPAVVRRLIERPTSAAHSDVALPAPALNALLYRLMQLEGRWLRRHTLPAGLSVLALAQKPATQQPT